MNVHKNARLTPSGRVLLVQRIKAGWSVVRALVTAGVSERTAHRWLGRYRGGDRQLTDRSSRPHHCPRRLAPDLIARVELLRRQRHSGPAIARALGMARSRVGRILCRLGLNRLDRLEPCPPMIRYGKARASEMIHIDIKSLGKIDGVGHRITGQHALCITALVAIGYERLHMAIDDASRLAYVELLPSLGREDATGFLNRALAWVRPYGSQGRAGDARLWLGLSLQAVRPGCCSRPRPATSEPGPIRCAPMARLNASSRHRCESGLMPGPMPHRQSALKLSSRGLKAIT